MAGRTPGSTKKDTHIHVVPKPVGHGSPAHHPKPAGHGSPAHHAESGSLKANQVTRIIVVYDHDTSRGTLYAVGADGKVVVKDEIVAGGDGQATPTGTFHASRWEKDHVSNKYGAYANTPWSKSPLGLNAFGPYQLHIKELEARGIYIHGTMGPGWNPVTTLNTLVSPTSHGCVRMSNAHNIDLHEKLPRPNGIEVKISTNPGDAPKE
jgi:lipoprotein-anchoring transpeptidase ErfK/SrfK